MTADRPPVPTVRRSGATRRRTKRRLLFAGITLFAACLAAGIVFELVFQVLDRIEAAQVVEEGDGGQWQSDPRWGWKPSVGWFRQATSEFDVTGQVNELHMNDGPVDPIGDAGLTRVLALGDSHTFAIGVSMEETWVKALERRLNASATPPSFRCYNAAMIGYNLHQYLLRLIDQGPIVRPHYVVVGLSYATDFYDLLPPDRGGWIYGALRGPRDYFDFDDSGDLAERHWDVPAAEAAAAKTRAQRVRRFLSHFATFRYLRRSRLALFIGSHFRLGGQSLWPNVEVVVERELGPQHEYQWRLATALLRRIDEESRALGAELIVLGIPYLPQVYDEIWEATFAGDERFDRDAAPSRLEAWCRSRGIAYVGTLEAFRRAIAGHGRWLHHRKDAHPTAEGQELIAETLLQAGIIRRRVPAAESDVPVPTGG